MNQPRKLSFSVKVLFALTLLIAAVLTAYQQGRNSAILEAKQAKERDAIWVRRSLEYLTKHDRSGKSNSDLFQEFEQKVKSGEITIDY